MRMIMLVSLLLLIITISGCIVKEQEVVCNKPYILVGTECCLDENDNSICDKDEITTTTINEELTKSEAVEKLIEAGCLYDLSEDSQCVVFEDPYWVIKMEGCLGECKINHLTGEIEGDPNFNPMCTGALVPNECQTDEDCSGRTGRCTTKYICIETSCIPSFD